MLLSITTLLMVCLALRSMRREAPSLIRRLELRSVLFVLVMSCGLAILLAHTREGGFGALYIVPLLVLLFLSPALFLSARRRPPLDAAALSLTLRRFGPFRGRRHAQARIRRSMEFLVLVPAAAVVMWIVACVPPTGFATVVISLLALSSAFTIAILARRVSLTR